MDIETTYGIISLIKSALTGEIVKLPKNYDFENAYKIACEHQINTLIYYGIKNSNIILSSEIGKIYRFSAINDSIIEERQLCEINLIYKKFNDNSIDYMPLKGINIKSLYPVTAMRSMSDVDILIKTEQYDKIINIMKSLGYIKYKESDHEYIWRKPTFLNVELHKKLIPSYNKDFFTYYNDGWRLARLSEKNKYELRGEDEFVFLFTHYSKHYRDSGIGLKHLIDLYLYEKTYTSLDNEYIKNELSKIKLYDFYLNTKKTLDVWFNGREPDEITDLITKRVFESGVYGTHENSVISSSFKESKNIKSIVFIKIKKLIKMILLPYDLMSYNYPILKKAPVLLPFFWLARIFNIVFIKKDKKNKIKKVNHDFTITTSENINKYKEELNKVGLDFNF